MFRSILVAVDDSRAAAKALEQAIDQAQSERARLTLISDAFSLLAKLESGDLVPALVDTDLGTVARQAVDRARDRVGGQAIRFAPEEAITVPVDAQLLGIALDQLLDNTQRHTPPGTKVDVRVTAEDGDVRVIVEDEGPGVPEEEMGQLFNRFYRGDPARGRQAGLGLGLTLAAAIVDLHGGRTTNAYTAWPRMSSGTPITAASRTPLML